MNSFAWVKSQSVAEAAQAASATVADTMRTLSAAQTGASIIKAGGIDVLDLMKENILAPQQVVSIRETPGLDAIANGESGLRIGSTVTLARLADDAIVRRYYPALAAAAEGSASPQIRNVATLGGSLLQRPRCWYFRSANYHCLRKGGGHCFAIGGENQYHAIFDNQACAIVHPSTVATVLVALDATIELIDKANTIRRIKLENFFITSSQNLHRENNLKPHEILAAIDLPRLAMSVRMAHLKQGERVCRLAACRCLGGSGPRF